MFAPEKAENQTKNAGFAILKELLDHKGDFMNYKSYIGVISAIEKNGLMHGEVFGIRDIITFQGTTPEELEKAFKESVDTYLAWCVERGELPELFELSKVPEYERWLYEPENRESLNRIVQGLKSSEEGAKTYSLEEVLKKF